MNVFTERAIRIIQSIPDGQVMTYGQVATLAGSPRAARQIVRILHSMSMKYQLPWHRVINVKGEIGFSDEEMFMEQKLLLESENIEFIDEKRINLDKHRFHPDVFPDYDWE